MNTDLDSIIDKLLLLKPIFKNMIKPQWITPQITLGTHYIIIILFKHGSLTMSEISNILTIPKPNVTTMVDKLIRQGFAKREYDSDDRRKIKVVLTEKGINLKTGIDTEIRNNLREKLVSLSDEDLNKLATSLNSVVDILSQITSE